MQAPARPVQIACFFCDGHVEEKDAKLTPRGKVYGPCCEDIGKAAQ
jgi:hypothetical protein